MSGSVGLSQSTVAEEVLAILRCLSCRGALDAREDELVCSGCGRKYPRVDGVFRFVDAQQYTGSFGFQWHVHARTQLDTARSSAISIAARVQATNSMWAGAALTRAWPTWPPAPVTRILTGSTPRRGSPRPPCPWRPARSRRSVPDNSARRHGCANCRREKEHGKHHEIHRAGKIFDLANVHRQQ